MSNKSNHTYTEEYRRTIAISYIMCRLGIPQGILQNILCRNHYISPEEHERRKNQLNELMDYKYKKLGIDRKPPQWE